MQKEQPVQEETDASIINDQIGVESMELSKKYVSHPYQKAAN